MISVLVSKWVADAFGKEGIYSQWIALRRYPWIPYTEYRDNGEDASSIIIPYNKLLNINAETSTLQELRELLETYSYHGFPVVSSENDLVGYITSHNLKSAIGPYEASLPDPTGQTFTFVRRLSSSLTVDLSGYLDKTTIQMRKEIPKELVVTMFQKMNMRCIFFTRFGKLEGLVTKSDIARVMTQHVPFAGVLERKGGKDLDNSAVEVVWEAR